MTAFAPQSLMMYPASAGVRCVLTGTTTSPAWVPARITSKWGIPLRCTEATVSPGFSPRLTSALASRLAVWPSSPNVTRSPYGPMIAHLPGCCAAMA